MIPAPVLELRAVLPLGVLALGAIAVLVLDLVMLDRSRLFGRSVTRAFVGTLLSLTSAVFLIVVLVLGVQNLVHGSTAVFNVANPLVQLDPLANFGVLLVAGGTLLVCLMSVAYLAELDINHGEYYALLLLSASGMVLLVSATDLLSLFLGLEVTAIPAYVLAGFDRGRRRGNEAALKYFLLGSFASAILLYGMALLYGATGATTLEAIRQAEVASSPLALAGMGLVLVGFAFKVSSVPFHQWVPDVYEGAPASVGGFFATTVKAAAFVALLRLLAVALGEGASWVAPMLAVLAALSMIVGNTMALIQQNPKRLLGYAAIGHAGYLLLGFVAATPEAYAAVLFYLTAYLFMTLGAFAVLVALANRGHDLERIGDLAGLAKKRPALAGALTLFAISLAGIPPTAGFLAKFQLFAAVVGAGHVGLVILAVGTSVLSAFYYLRLPVLMVMREPEGPPPRLHLASGEWLVVGVCALAVVTLGLLPNGLGVDSPSLLPPALDWSRDAITALLASR